MARSRRSSRLLSAIGAAFSISTSNSSASSLVKQERDPSLGAIERDLASKLEELVEHGRAAGGMLNLVWLQEAMSAVLSMNSIVEAMISPGLCFPNDGCDINWLDDYLDDNAKLLDACNLLKEGLRNVEVYQSLVQAALISLDGVDAPNSLNKYRRCRAALGQCIATKLADSRFKLESCSSSLRRMGDRLAASQHSDHSMALTSAIYGSKLCTLFICRLLAVALCPNLLKGPNCSTASHGSPSYLWSSSLTTLQSMAKEEMLERSKNKASSVAYLLELEKLDCCVRKLHDLLNKVLLQQGSVQLSEPIAAELTDLCHQLRTFSDQMGKVTVLQLQVNELFRMLVSTRVAVLDFQTHCRSCS